MGDIDTAARTEVLRNLARTWSDRYVTNAWATCGARVASDAIFEALNMIAGLRTELARTEKDLDEYKHDWAKAKLIAASLKEELEAERRGRQAYLDQAHERERALLAELGEAKAALERRKVLSDEARLDVMWQELVREKDAAKFALSETRCKLETLSDRIVTVADEACGLGPVMPAEDALTRIEAELFRLRVSGEASEVLVRGLTARGEQLHAEAKAAVAGLRAIPYGASPAATQLHVTKVVNALERVLKGGS